MNQLKTINENPITPSEMESFLQAIEAQGDQSFESSVLIARQVFPNDQGKRFSINMRLTALSKILESQSLPGWVKSTNSEGIIDVAENLYMAAGLEQMIELDNDWGFNLDALLKRAFQLGKVNA